MVNEAGEEQAVSYAKAVARLEQIIHSLEDGEIDIDELAENVKEAAKLLDLCKEKIERAEMEVKEIAEHLEVEAEPGDQEGETEDASNDGVPF
jgi:exodeoxyribonuclease VII small subunit